MQQRLVFLKSWVRDFFFPFIPFNIRSYTVTVFPSFIAGSCVVFYSSAVEFFEEQYAYSVCSGPHDQRSVPGGNQLTDRYPSCSSADESSEVNLLSAKRLLSRCTETVGGNQTHLGTTQNPVLLRDVDSK
jgi:hypothetical protein